MSATNRGTERDKLDRYDTPAWPVFRLLDRVGDSILLPSGRWLEPCAGGGAIRHAVEAWRPTASIDWTEIDIAPRHRRVVKADFLSWVWRRPAGQRFDVAVSNPPYVHALAFAWWCVQLSISTALLLRLNWIEGAVTEEPRRYDFLKSTKPDVFVLPNRPQYERDGQPLRRDDGTKRGSDATAYAWIVWHPHADRRWDLLDATPIEHRRAV